MFAFVQQLSDAGYFGQIVLNFQSGYLLNIRRDESLKPENLTNPTTTTNPTSLMAPRRGVSNGTRNS